MQGVLGRRDTPQTTTVLNALGTNAAPLYNGNIAAMAVNIPRLGSTKLYNYHYDQLNRIAAMDVYNGLNPASGTFTPVSISDYKERFSYNPDGGILTLLRNGAGSTVIDNAVWNYYAGTHRLEHINDPAGRYGFDAGNQAANNYSYDAIGEMTGDVERGLTATWNVYGKPSSQTIGSTTINFTYDASGNRTSKTLSNGYKEFYVRDAGGNVMSIYRSGDASLNSGDLSQAEINLYGSNRLGSARPNTDVQTIVSNTIALSGGFGNAVVSTFTRGSKLFELTDHRSNDMVTVTDRRQQVSADNTTVSYYVADILTAQDYSSFGSLLQGRQFGSTPRYTYNGKQLDTETGWQDYGMRAYLVDVPIFGSVDPSQKKYPGETPYLYTGGNPIYYIDPDGKDRIEHVRIIGKDGTVLIKTQTTKGLYKAVWNNTYYGVGYATKNDYEVFTTHDLRTGKDVITTSTNTLYGPDHETEIGTLKYLKIKVMGSDGDILPKLPQLLVFGSGSTDPGWGTKADPNRPITVIDFAAFESIMGLVMTGMKVPDLKGAAPKKIPELVDKYRKQVIYERKKNQVEQCEACGLFKQNGKEIDTTGKGIKAKDIKQVPIEQFHQ